MPALPLTHRCVSQRHAQRWRVLANPLLAHTHQLQDPMPCRPHTAVAAPLRGRRVRWRAAALRAVCRISNRRPRHQARLLRCGMVAPSGTTAGSSDGSGTAWCTCCRQRAVLQITGTPPPPPPPLPPTHTSAPGLSHTTTRLLRFGAFLETVKEGISTERLRRIDGLEHERPVPIAAISAKQTTRLCRVRRARKWKALPRAQLPLVACYDKAPTWSKGERCPSVCDRRFHGGWRPGALRRGSPVAYNRSSCSPRLGERSASIMVPLIGGGSAGSPEEHFSVVEYEQAEIFPELRAKRGSVLRPSVSLAHEALCGEITSA